MGLICIATDAVIDNSVHYKTLQYPAGFFMLPSHLFINSNFINYGEVVHDLD